jgi:serine/threonine-protein kinase
MEALQVARQVAESLSEAHEHGVFHRDLKPDNIFIETVGVSKVVKVLDFGIAGGVDATRLTQAGEVFGTPQYMSPEQCNGLPLDHRTDIYSLAAILYEMIEGRPPFSAETPMATMLKHVRAKVPSLRRGAKETARVVLMGLRKDRGKRIQTAGRFAELIGQSIGHLRAHKEGRVVDTPMAPVTPSTGTPLVGAGLPSQPMPFAPPGEDRRGLFIALGLGIAAALIVGLLLFGDFGGGESPDPDAAGESGEATASPPVGGGEGKSYDKYPLNRAFVSTKVKGATVHVDGEAQCETPCEIEVPVGDGKMHEIRITHDGYIDVVQNWQPRNVGDPLPRLPDMQEL